MRSPAPVLLAALYLALPTPGLAEDSPSTVSDDGGIRKQEPVAVAPIRRHFNGYATRFTSGTRDKQRHYFPGATHYSTIKLERAK